MPLKQRFDRLLLGAAILQTAAGLIFMTSASWLIAVERYHRPGTYFLAWQGAAALVGLGVLVAAMHLRRELLEDPRLAGFLLAGCWVLLAAAFLQPAVAHTHRWLRVGGISLQPSVLARVALIIFAAVALARAAAEGWAPRRLAVVAGAGLGTAALVVAEPDLGSTVLILGVLAGMALVAGMPLRLVAAPALAAVLAVAVAVAVSPYRRARVLAFVDPAASAATAWQTRQSLIALGSGGLAGRGYGAGLQKLFFLPEPHTDFIFAIVGEELGLGGVGALLLLAGVITWRGLRIAVRQTNPVHGLLAFGLTFAFAAQTLIHMAVCLGLAPPKGIPLPLVSYGKTDLVVSLGSIGLLLNFSREVGP